MNCPRHGRPLSDDRSGRLLIVLAKNTVKVLAIARSAWKQGRVNLEKLPTRKSCLEAGERGVCGIAVTVLKSRPQILSVPDMFECIGQGRLASRKKAELSGL